MIRTYITRPSAFPFEEMLPWKIIASLDKTLDAIIPSLGSDYAIRDGVAIHTSATIGHNVTIKAPAVISAGCFVGSNSYLRNGVFLAPGAKVGIACEIKTSILLEGAAVAHFNFVGDSIIGHDVNIEAGAILANHFNERPDRSIWVRHDGVRIPTGMHKFGALVGDGCRIGANAVLSPGTLLKPRSVVRRLELVEQDPVSCADFNDGTHRSATSRPTVANASCRTDIPSATSGSTPPDNTTIPAGTSAEPPTPGLQLDRVHHIAVICSDYRRSLDFYTRVLGLRLAAEHYRAERLSYKADLTLGGDYVIELFSFPSAPPRPTRPEAAGLRHLAFAVASVGEAAERLDSMGVAHEPIRTDAYTGKRFLFFQDPDGLPLELYER